MVPSARDGFAGVTVMATSTGAPTVSDAEPLRPAYAAVTEDVPVVNPIASPELVTLITVGAELVHVAEAVKSCVVSSLNVPVATNCWLVPSGIVAVAGVIAIETTTAPVTLRVVELEMELEVAEMVTVPGPELVARP